jgi:hypothetical protein
MVALSRAKTNPWLSTNLSPEIKRRRDAGVGISLVDSYREYAHFQRDLRGFWSILRLCEGNDNKLSAFRESIKEKRRNNSL